MSEAETKKQPGQESTAPTGSKRWFWSMRGSHAVLWMLPVIPAAYITGDQRRHDWHGALTIWYVWTPWVLFTAALVVTSRALWRTEVNLAGNRQRPFTPKDRKVLALASASAVGSAMYAACMTFLRPSGMSQSDWDSVGSGLSAILIASLCVSVLTASMRRMHCKGAHAYEELEKGV